MLSLRIRTGKIEISKARSLTNGRPASDSLNRGAGQRQPVESQQRYQNSDFVRNDSANSSLSTNSGGGGLARHDLGLNSASSDLSGMGMTSSSAASSNYGLGKKFLKSLSHYHSGSSVSSVNTNASSSSPPSCSSMSKSASMTATANRQPQKQQSSKQSPFSEMIVTRY